jgi:polysaccharide export outer membrane protein
MPPKVTLFACGLLWAGMTVQSIPVLRAQDSQQSRLPVPDPGSYRLGTGDEISIRVLDLDEIPDKPFRLGVDGNLSLPLAGQIHASGRTVAELQLAIAERLREILKDPQVTVTLAAFREQSVAVLGAVNSPGVRELHGRATLLDAISEAGGFKPEAGAVITITRPKSSGPIPLPGSHLDNSGEFYMAEADVHSLLRAQNPRENIPLLPHDVVTVPAAEMIYILGEVAKPGGYEVQGSRTLSVLDAVALAGGANRNASSSRARVLRLLPGKTDPAEYTVDLNRLLAGKQKDFQLLPKDILYIPTNKAKVVSTRALETLVGTGSSIAVFRSAH